MSKHIPTPWFLDSGAVYAACSSGQNVCVAKADRGPDNTILPSVRDANMRHIVRAVNAHEALISALEHLIREAGAYRGARMPLRDETLNRAFFAAHNALTLAEGR